MERNPIQHFDWILTAAVGLLCAMGLFILYSAGFDPETKRSMAMERQAYSMGLGFICYLVGVFINPSFWKRWAFVVYAAGIIMLVLLLTKGYEAKGATRWLDLGFFRMQPSEFVKIGVILALARVLSDDRAPRDGYTLRTLIPPLVLVLVPMGAILVQPDLGTALSVGLISASMILLAGVRGRTIFSILGSGVLLLIPAWNFFLKEYQKQRVRTFLSPETDPLGAGYHAMQSKIAVGSGMLAGKGFLQGTQTQLRFLPEQTTDFIFSVLAEEWGFIGSLVVLVLYSVTVLHVISVVYKSNDQFTSFVCWGVGAMVFWHVVINIGMVVGIVPVVGITLPLLSYGGSSVISMLAGLGLVAGVYRRRFFFATTRFR